MYLTKQNKTKKTSKHRVRIYDDGLYFSTFPLHIIMDHQKLLQNINNSLCLTFFLLHYIHNVLTIYKKKKSNIPVTTTKITSYRIKQNAVDLIPQMKDNSIFTPYLLTCCIFHQLLPLLLLPGSASYQFSIYRQTCHLLSSTQELPISTKQ